MTTADALKSSRKLDSADPSSRLHRFAEILASELSVFYYAFAAWRRPLPEPSAESGAETFFSRERSGYGLLVGGVIVATAVEIVPVHLLLSHFWTPIAGWIATGLALYGVVWLLADWQATRRLPTRLTSDALHVRVGLRWRIEVPYSAVESLRRVSPSEVKVAEALQAFAAGRPTHCLELKESLEANGPYGLRRTVRRIALQVDETRRFEETLEKRLSGNTSPGQE